MTIRIVAISDTHGRHWKLDIPPGDILIHAGDCTRQGTLDELRDFDHFLSTLPHSHKLLVAGNHDFCLEEEPQASAKILQHATYLLDRAVTIEGINFYGSPWQPWFMDWAFNLHRGPQIRARWDLIPAQTDVLITHGPPFGRGDTTFRQEQVGCEDLLEAVQRVRPAYHIFGHIHEGYGQTQNEFTRFINAASCNLTYDMANPAMIIDYHLQEAAD